jgi:hypothetical protein
MGCNARKANNNFCHATKPSYATQCMCPHKAIRATFLLQYSNLFSQWTQHVFTAFTGTNWYDDNKLSSSRRGCHHSCSVQRPTCYLYHARKRCLPGSWFLNAVNTSFGELFGQGIGCTHSGKGEHRRNTSIRMWEEQQRKQGSSECKTEHTLNRKHLP